MDASNSRVAVVLFGAPGSGKGTQAQALVERFGLLHISTGDMLRRHVEADDEVGHEVKALMEAGQLVPDELVNRLVAAELDRPEAVRGVILDGYPRTLAQAEMLHHILAERGIPEVIIHLRVDYNEVIARLAARRQCPRCGAVYNLVSNPPKRSGICDRDGAALLTRPDDREDVIRNRMEAYELQTRPLLDYLTRTSERFYEVDTRNRSAEAISKEIAGLVGAR
ncbi:MAG: adenylate kinase [Bryobacterales bacterium]|nr:adenylate kinase [Bryobacteraceae bacterium]MDW8354804.1 adenylate kinase [Bryobacterales bacterium]